MIRIFKEQRQMILLGLLIAVVLVIIGAIIYVNVLTKGQINVLKTLPLEEQKKMFHNVDNRFYVKDSRFSMLNQDDKYWDSVFTLEEKKKIVENYLKKYPEKTEEVKLNKNPVSFACRWYKQTIKTADNKKLESFLKNESASTTENGKPSDTKATEYTDPRLVILKKKYNQLTTCINVIWVFAGLTAFFYVDLLLHIRFPITRYLVPLLISLMVYMFLSCMGAMKYSNTINNFFTGNAAPFRDDQDLIDIIVEAGLKAPKKILLGPIFAVVACFAGVAFIITEKNKVSFLITELLKKNTKK